MIKKLFYCSIAIAILINLLSDFNIFQIGKDQIIIGNQVSDSYLILQSIDAVKIKILASQLKEKIEPDLRNSFQKLDAVMVDLPSQKIKVFNLTQLSEQQILKRSNNLAILTLTEMSVTENALLADRLKRDQAINSEGINQAIFANAVDMVLILFALVFFLYEKKLEKRLQKALTLSLAHVESVNQKLQQNLIKKDSKLRTTVHDLKNPLGSIRGFAELLQDELGNNKSLLEMTQIIQRISNSTLSLVGSVLENENEIENDALAIREDIKVLECLKETCAFLEPAARSKKQKIVFESNNSEFSFWDSRQKIQDVFYNIVGNAIKFSPLGAIVTVNCFEDGNCHAIQIKDQGPGFSEVDFPKMFVAGMKLSAKPSAGENSTGIGLYSAKQAVDSFHGSIEITNNATTGACVTIRFPFNSSPSAS